MQLSDLDLLTALDALLAEGSVTKAAARLNKSVPAMSRTLGRLRQALGDPLFVRAGRGLSPTPRALALSPGLRAVLAQVEALFKPQAFDPRDLTRTFVIRCTEDVTATLGAAMMEAVCREAPDVVLRFALEGDEDVAALRHGLVDLDVGVPAGLGPEIKTVILLRDRYLGAARIGCPVFAAPMDAARFAQAGHISSSRRGLARGPIDAALAELGLARRVRLITPGSGSALGAALNCDLLAAVPGFIARAAVARGLGLRLFELPVKTPEFALAMSWHPRLQADPGHAWLRGKLRRAVAGI